MAKDAAVAACSYFSVPSLFHDGGDTKGKASTAVGHDSQSHSHGRGAPRHPATFPASPQTRASGYAVGLSQILPARLAALLRPPGQAARACGTTPCCIKSPPPPSLPSTAPSAADPHRHSARAAPPASAPLYYFTVILHLPSALARQGLMTLHYRCIDKTYLLRRGAAVIGSPMQSIEWKYYRRVETVIG